MESSIEEEVYSTELLERAEVVLETVAEMIYEEKKKQDIETPKTKAELVEEALNCPCISKMKEGSCGDAFISAYRCFLESETEPRGMDCMEKFQTMQDCMNSHPEEYNFEEVDPDAPPTDDPSQVPQPAHDHQHAQS
mmetsp:Transcript_4501/g.7890  ORF Transcript_4501/g.7890 Transcript_4501/m.7890 type:complete len:137 (-) Transcript_4501:189-599(-)|eukprot:CAMPEP_0182446772 /NCGR_PEP_ID=MMETSP1172-20130603/5992_1 /TAXON_ID=708627 /ORGANISM="Timspurckia oligopyrenoides, Strain CCMP3278" /LENGTH=136 /DNA_ID=CAMNT_0024642843 /DNA_START=311 /DNA_END=721 /DNA_ORIENTATION=-